MKTILVGLSALSLLVGFSPTTHAQSITITTGPAEVSPETNDSYWVWNDEYQCWIWTGPEFRGDYEGHPYSYWHGRHEGGGDHNHRPAKVEHHEGEHHEGEHHEGDHHDGDHHDKDGDQH
jgi:hypothetical protein